MPALPSMPAPRPAADGRDWRRALRGLDPALANLPAGAPAAHILASRGCWQAAETLYGELIRLQPAQPDLLRSYAQVLRLLGKGEAATAMRKRALEAEVSRFGIPEAARAETARFLTGLEDGAPAPARLPPSYVAMVFDRYDDYEQRMMERLHYQAPQALLRAVVAALGPDPHPRRILDLGCGTGLMGAVIKPLATRLDGIDLSPAMVERSRARGIYDQLEAGDLFALLGARARDYDLLVAADVCPYIGDLAPFLAAGARALADGGLLAFTVERGDAGWSLGGTRRFVHSPEHVREAATAGRWRVVSLTDAVLRLEADAPVAGLVAVLAAP
jgi:predicted TPR repeat methyltransferase